MDPDLLRALRMLILLAFAVFLTLITPLFWSHSVSEMAVSLQQICFAQSPISRHTAVYSALVCGQSLSQHPGTFVLKSDLARTALIHLVVASSGQLHFIDSVLRKLLNQKLAAWLIPITLVFFALLTGLGPPYVRVLIAWTLRAVSQRLKLNWTPVQILTMAGFFSLWFALGICDRPGDLLSLSLSWIAGLAILCASDFRMTGGTERKARRLTWQEKIKSQLRFHSILYLLMIPALLPLRIAHPLTIFWNLAAAPLFNFILFPCSLAAFAFPRALLSILDPIFDLFEIAVHNLSLWTPQGLAKFQVPTLLTWLYLFTLTLAALAHENWTARDSVHREWAE